MSQDIIADGLNQVMNAKRSRKEKVIVKSSKFFLNLLALAQQEGYLTYKELGRSVEISFTLNECKAIKPRFTVTKDNLEKYMRRYLPSRKLGVLVISTNQGLMTHKKVLELGLGGCLIAYFY